MKIGDKLEWATERRSKVDRSTECGTVIACDRRKASVVTQDGSIKFVTLKGLELVK